jgi:hypothetical protein
MSKWEMKWVICGTVAFSLLMNIGHCFQYRIDYGWGIHSEDYLYSDYILADFYPSIVHDNLGFNVFAIVYFCVNFLGFLVINTGVEMNLIKNLRKEIVEKKGKMEKEINTMIMNNSSGSMIINKLIRDKQKKIEQDAKKEQRATIMVITNSFVNFYLRLPEVLVFFVSTCYSNNLGLTGNCGATILAGSVIYQFLSNIINLKNTIVSFAYLMYILTFTTNVAVYYVFNTKFRQLFIWWENNVKLK